MVIDITDIKQFDTRLFHHMVDNKDHVVLVGSNPHLERCLNILGIDKVVKHEKDPEKVKAILTKHK